MEYLSELFCSYCHKHIGWISALAYIPNVMCDDCQEESEQGKSSDKEETK